MEYAINMTKANFMYYKIMYHCDYLEIQYAYKCI